MSRKLSPEIIAEARRIRAAGMALTAIAGQLGVSKSAIGRAVADIDTDMRPEMARRQAAARKTPEFKTRAVLALHAAGFSGTEITDLLNISSSVVYRTISGAGVGQLMVQPLPS